MVANNSNVRPQVRDHRTNTAERPRVQDHRREPTVRDHRTSTRPPVVPQRVRYVDTYPTPPVVRDNTQAARNEFDNIFSRNDLSIEDKVMMLLFSVMSKMDQDITDKGKKISQSKSDTPTTTQGGVKSNGNSAANGPASQDQQALELQQLVTRRANLFATLNAIVNKFDESADKVIRKLGQ